MPPQPVDYASKLARPSPRWCLSAVLGFALSAPGPILGLMLYATFDAIHRIPRSDILFCFIALVPMALGLVFSLRALAIMSQEIPKQRGENLAAAGILCCGLWMMPVIFLLLLEWSQ